MASHERQRAQRDRHGAHQRDDNQHVCGISHGRPPSPVPVGRRWPAG
jgi:hypothetical protein